MWIGSPIPKTRLAACGVGSEVISDERVTEMQRVGAQLVEPEPPKRDQQVIASHAPEAGQREALE